MKPSLFQTLRARALLIWQVACGHVDVAALADDLALEGGGYCFIALVTRADDENGHVSLVVSKDAPAPAMQITVAAMLQHLVWKAEACGCADCRTRLPHFRGALEALTSDDLYLEKPETIQ